MLYCAVLLNRPANQAPVNQANATPRSQASQLAAGLVELESFHPEFDGCNIFRIQRRHSNEDQ